MFGAPEPLMENSRIRAVLAFARVVRDTSNTKDALTAANALLAGTLMDKEPEEVENAVRQIVERAEMIRSAGDQKSLFLSYIDEISLDDEAVGHFREGLDAKDYEEIIDYCRGPCRCGFLCTRPQIFCIQHRPAPLLQRARG